MRLRLAAIVLAVSLGAVLADANELLQPRKSLSNAADLMKPSLKVAAPRAKPRKQQQQRQRTASAAELSTVVTAAPAVWRAPSFYWAVLHNWLYFLSLGMNIPNMQFLVREIVDGKGAQKASATAIALSGRVESVDKLITFLGVGYLAALSDVAGRKALIVWSSLGFALTNFIQANTRSASSLGLLYLADFIDGCTSCMAPVCQAYVADCSHPTERAANLGIFQGLSIGCAFSMTSRGSNARWS